MCVRESVCACARLSASLGSFLYRGCVSCGPRPVVSVLLKYLHMCIRQAYVKGFHSCDSPRPQSAPDGYTTRWFSSRVLCWLQRPTSFIQSGDFLPVSRMLTCKQIGTKASDSLGFRLVQHDDPEFCRHLSLSYFVISTMGGCISTLVGQLSHDRHEMLAFPDSPLSST